MTVSPPLIRQADLRVRLRRHRRGNVHGDLKPLVPQLFRPDRQMAAPRQLCKILNSHLIVHQNHQRIRRLHPLKGLPGHDHGNRALHSPLHRLSETLRTLLTYRIATQYHHAAS